MCVFAARKLYRVAEVGINFRHHYVIKDDLAYCGGQQLYKTLQDTTRQDLWLLEDAHPPRDSSRAPRDPRVHAVVVTYQKAKQKYKDPVRLCFKHHHSLNKNLLYCFIISVYKVTLSEGNCFTPQPLCLWEIILHLKTVQLRVACKFWEIIQQNKVGLSLRSTGSEWVSDFKIPGSPRRKFWKRTEYTRPWQFLHFVLSHFPSKCSCCT
jgi:hypothetical protein